MSPESKRHKCFSPDAFLPRNLFRSFRKLASRSSVDERPRVLKHLLDLLRVLTKRDRGRPLANRQVLGEVQFALQTTDLAEVDREEGFLARRFEHDRRHLLVCAG